MILHRINKFSLGRLVLNKNTTSLPVRMVQIHTFLLRVANNIDTINNLINMKSSRPSKFCFNHVEVLLNSVLSLDFSKKKVYNLSKDLTTNKDITNNYY